ncbi:MAG: dihydropteroate synthase [Pseudomonadota bacterium]
MNTTSSLTPELLKLGPLRLPRPALLGVLNVTPDSFSDGGHYHSIDRAVEHAIALEQAGADVIDVGGESTRPGAAPVSETVELARVLPVVKQLAEALTIPVSVDTSSPAVMAESLAAGAAMINDVRALQRPGTLSVLADSDAAVCLMHMQGQPGSMQDRPEYQGVVEDVLTFLKSRLAACRAAGIDHERLAVDPGFGFGKTLQHNLTLLANLDAVKSLGAPVLVGVSRKSMFDQLLGRAVDERLAGTLAAGLLAVQSGADILRVHDVAEHRDVRCVMKAVANHRVHPANTAATGRDQ